MGYQVYDFDTVRFRHPRDVTFNVNVTVLPYISSLNQLVPSVRLLYCKVSKKFNNSYYNGRVVCTCVDSDGEILYGVCYSDNDYEEEYTFLELLKILQPYDPLDDEDDVLEITPFFGHRRQNGLHW